MFFIYYITQQLNYPNMKTGGVLLTRISCEIEFIYIIIPLCVKWEQNTSPQTGKTCDILCQVGSFGWETH